MLSPHVLLGDILSFCLICQLEMGFFWYLEFMKLVVTWIVLHHNKTKICCEMRINIVKMANYFTMN